MSRPLRIEFPDAIYHVTSRGDRQEPIYRDDTDRRVQLDVMAHAMDRFSARMLAYCQMGNHFHLVLQTQDANLSRLMRHINGVYTQAFNRRHGVVGHLFQGRFKAILVDRDSYLLALCRYVERNPVAAGLVAAADRWPWSSCQAHLGQVATPPWLESSGLHAHLLGRLVRNTRDSKRATALYAKLLGQDDERSGTFWHQGLRGQIYLGDEAFVERMRAQAAPTRLKHTAIPKRQRLGVRTLQQWLAMCAGRRDEALTRAYREGGLTMTALASEAGLSVSHVSRLIRAFEGDGA